MEYPSTPRMPEVNYRLIWIAGAVNLLRLVLVSAFGHVVDWLTAGAIAACYVYIGVRLLLHRWHIRRAIGILRRLTPTDRLAILNGLDDVQSKAFFEYRLAEHGEPQITGVVERFGFSPVDRRELTLATWATAVGAVLAALAPASMQLAGLWKATAYSCALLLGFVVLILLRRAEQVARTFEVSPFGLTEQLPDGAVRRVLWGYGLVLRNRPWLQRIELAPADSPESIKIPYSVVGFDRLVEQVVSKGGFQTNEAA